MINLFKLLFEIGLFILGVCLIFKEAKYNAQMVVESEQELHKHKE